MGRESIDAAELEAKVLDEIRSNDACRGVISVEIRHEDLPHLDSNWSVSVSDYGNVHPYVANRAAINAQATLRQKYVLATD